MYDWLLLTRLRTFHLATEEKQLQRMTTLPDFPSFDVNADPTSLGIAWKKWTTRLENLFLALDIQSEERRKALLLYYGGEELSDIFNTLAEATES